MKTRDKEALQYILETGHWRLEEDGSITTRRDKKGKVTDPEVWRPCEFLSQGNRGSARKRIWVNGRRVYSARAAWTLHTGALPPEGLQVDHIDDDSQNNRGSNLQLLDCYGNIQKETLNGRVKWFAAKETYCQSTITREPVYIGMDLASKPDYRTGHEHMFGPPEEDDLPGIEEYVTPLETPDLRPSIRQSVKEWLRKVREWWRDVVVFLTGQY